MTELAPLFSSLWTSIETFPEAEWKTALSYGQLRSKEWLIEKAHETFKDRTFSTAFVIGGWYGVLPALWKQHAACPVKKFRSIDRDESCRNIAETINKKWVIDDWQFKATTADALTVNYHHPELVVVKSSGETEILRDVPNLIINTCCEHFADLKAWLERVPEGVPLILQSNNLRDDSQHVGCHFSLDEFKAACGLSTVLFAQELPLDRYSRYMIMGWR